MFLRPLVHNTYDSSPVSASKWLEPCLSKCSTMAAAVISEIRSIRHHKIFQCEIIPPFGAFTAGKHIWKSNLKFSNLICSFVPCHRMVTRYVPPRFHCRIFLRVYVFHTSRMSEELLDDHRWRTVLSSGMWWLATWHYIPEGRLLSNHRCEGVRCTNRKANGKR